MVSVIIINYNTFDLTSNCIRSIYKHTTGVEYEIIVVDNASTECDADLFKKEFPEVTLIKSTENVGFSKGNNLGIAKAKGDLVLLLNSDTVFIENSLLKCVEKLKALPDNVAAISCKLSFPDGRIQRQCSRFPSISNEFLELTRLHKFLSPAKRSERFLGFYFDHENDIYPDWLWGTFFMFRRSALDALPEKKLNDDYFMYCEDMRWCYDLKMAGMKVYYFAGTTVMHHSDGSSGPGTKKSEKIILNELDFTAKTRGKFYMLIYGRLKALNILFSSSRSDARYERFSCYVKTTISLFYK